MKTQIYKRGKRTFRYNFDEAIVEYISKADAEMIADDKEWKANHNGSSLWDIDEDGYITLDSAGLSRENWKHKESRNYYLDQWNDELDEEAAYQAYLFEKYELPLYQK